MMRRTARLLLSVGVAMFALGATPPDDHGPDRTLRDILGLVESISETTDTDGTVWLDVTLTTRDGERLEARVAPVDVLEVNEFRLEVGDQTRIRLFVDEEPAGVSRIRNLDTGQTLRLRCLRGTPIWNLRESHAGAGSPAQAPHRGRGRGPS